MGINETAIHYKATSRLSQVQLISDLKRILFVIYFIGMTSWTKKSVSRSSILSSAQVGMLQKLLENS